MKRLRRLVLVPRERHAPPAASPVRDPAVPPPMFESKVSWLSDPPTAMANRIDPIPAMVKEASQKGHSRYHSVSATEQQSPARGS